MINKKKIILSLILITVVIFGIFVISDPDQIFSVSEANLNTTDVSGSTLSVKILNNSDSDYYNTRFEFHIKKGRTDVAVSSVTANYLPAKELWNFDSKIFPQEQIDSGDVVLNCKVKESSPRGTRDGLLVVFGCKI